VSYDVILGRSEGELKLINASYEAEYLAYQVNYAFTYDRSEGEMKLINASCDAEYWRIS